MIREPPRRGRLLTVDAVQEIMRERIVGGSGPTRYWVLTHLPQDKKVRIGRATHIWEDDFEAWWESIGAPDK